MAKTTSPTALGTRSASASSSSVPGVARTTSSDSATGESPTSRNGVTASPQTYQARANGFDNNFGELSGLFSPSILQNASRSNSADYISYPGTTKTSINGLAMPASISSTNGKVHMPNGRQGSSTSITGSPASSMSHTLDSSCGTTPESSAESPDNRKSSEGTLPTVNEEAKSQDTSGGKEIFCSQLAKACENIANPISPMLAESNGASATSNMVKSPFADINGIDWLAQQNGGQFDPVLFGDYRDPQENILNNNSFGDYFNDAFPVQDLQDFSSAYNTADFASPPPKQDLMQQVDKQKEGSPLAFIPSDEARQFISCDKVWLVHLRILEWCVLILPCLGIVCEIPREPSLARLIWMIYVRSLRLRRSALAKVLSLNRKILMQFWAPQAQRQRIRMIFSRCFHNLIRRLVGSLLATGVLLGYEMIMTGYETWSPVMDLVQRKMQGWI